LSSIKNVGFIWDIDGVVVDSPHEEAWRITAMKESWGIDELSSDFYFTHVASRPRYEGGNNILEFKGVYQKLGADSHEKRSELLKRYCNEKNALIQELIKAGKFQLFPDALQVLLQAKKRGVLQAAASASKNAKNMLLHVSRQRMQGEIGQDISILQGVESLYDIFDVDACGLDLGAKENIHRFAAGRLNARCMQDLDKFVVFEDAPSGVKAAKSCGYYAVGVLRIGEEDALSCAGADVVLRDLRLLDIDSLLSQPSQGGEG
jgi:beta-phosphoglucomutase-like phosphatase (HAD superfamily)